MFTSTVWASVATSAFLSGLCRCQIAFNNLFAGKARIDKGSTNRFGILGRNPADSGGVVPGLINLISHIDDDFLCLFPFEEEAGVLGQNIRRIGKAALVTAFHGKVAAILAHHGDGVRS